MKRFFGKKAVIEAFKQNSLSEIYYTSYFEELNMLKESSVKINKVNRSFFNKFDVNHQYIMGISNDQSISIENDLDIFISKIPYKNKGEKSIILVLDEIQDPGNFGAICRTCKAFGVDGVIFKKNNQIQINETVIKTSLGTANYLNFLKVSNILDVIKKLKRIGYWSICGSLNEKSVSLLKLKTNIEKIILIVGNESKGVSELIQKDSDFLVKIDMTDSVQSLNVSSSTAILLHYLRYCI